MTAHASDDRARAVEDLQHTLGEGPGVAASESGAAVLVPDLRNGADHGQSRWPVFARDAVEFGVLAAFAFPLLLGTLEDRRHEPLPHHAGRAELSSSSPRAWWLLTRWP